VRRFLALLGAIGMIVGAVALRNAIDDDGGDGGEGDPENPAGPVSIACVTELQDACDEVASETLDITIEDAEQTAADPDRFDAWVTFDPWPAMADLPDGGEALAWSPLVIAIIAERAAVLRAECDPIGWRCLGDVAGQDWSAIGGSSSWGDVTVGLAPPDTALGRILLGNAASGYFGTTGFASNDFDLAFQRWVDQLLENADPNAVRLFLTQLGSYSAVGATNGELGAPRPTVEVIGPVPGASAIVVAAPIGGRGRDAVERLAGDAAFRDALANHGWQTDDIPDDAGLPAPGVLVALGGV
jgi:hypothetical protein